MKIGKRMIYWDACLLIAYIAGEPFWDLEILQGIEDLVEEINTERCILLTSTITLTEIFLGELTVAQKAKLNDVFKRPNLMWADVNTKVADRASSIREHYRSKGINIATPDAIHLATAILYKTDTLYTLDGAGKRCRPHHLLRLNGNVADTALKIEKPWRFPPQPPEEPEAPLFAAVGL
jgi:predicted nucleic acid-binding protein